MEIFSLYMFPLIAGLVIIKVFRIPLGKFVYIYGLLAAITVVTRMLYYSDFNLLMGLIFPVGGLLVVVILTGALEHKISSANYSSLLVVIGLFPWFMSTAVSIWFLVLAPIFLMFHSLLRQKAAFKSLGVSSMPLKLVKKKLSTDNYNLFVSRASVIYAMPFLVAVILVLSVYALSQAA